MAPHGDLVRLTASGLDPHARGHRGGDVAGTAHNATNGFLAGLIPEFIPVIGPLDDIVVVALCPRYAGRQISREVLLAARPGEPRLIERLLGQPREPQPAPGRSA